MRIKILKLIMVIAAVLMLCACSTPIPQEKPTGDTDNENVSKSEDKPTDKIVFEGIDAGNYPIVDGSTANMPLMAQVYSDVCGVSLDEAQTMVEVSTTAYAWRNLLDKKVDLLLVYEAPEAVKVEIEASDTKLEITPIGRDGLVFLANTKNKVDNLSSEQIKDIYTGKTTSWSELGGDDTEIVAFQRDKESGSQTLFEKLLMKGTQPMEAKTELRPADMGALIDGVSYYDGSNGAIGYSVFYYAKEMYSKPNLKLLSVDGVAPSVETIGSGEYPLVNNFYAAIRADEAEESPARILYNYLVGDYGRDVVRVAGYAPIEAKE